MRSGLSPGQILNKKASSSVHRESWLCVYASGLLLNTILSCTISTFVSFPHFGQKSGNFMRTVSAYTFVLVLFPQIGQGTHRETSFSSATIITSSETKRPASSVWLLPYEIASAAFHYVISFVRQVVVLYPGLRVRTHMLPG